ncbi:hypothetical protein VST7929_00164 [Vibrio stylophorae]|uniref:Type II secretion system protein N n=1 Tax=Vibrio stylophorae TaxID=659351 RepID=A0ABM8ZPV1_9VIBR|nr:type II secretion system protein N [Vibrio stylophorae]CAH0532346.1 hypothetical protein VST7929_00164 [Vibrio stylophorae]
MRRWLPYALVALAFFVLSLVAHVPALLALQQAPQLRAQAVSGTLWQGQTGQLTLPLGKHAFAMGALSWRMSPWTALIGRPNVDFELSGDIGALSGQGQLAWRWGDISGHDLMLNSQISAWQRYWQPYGVTLLGDFTLGVQHIALNQYDCAELKGQLIWTDPQINTPMGQMQPGDLLVTLRCDGPRYRADLNHQSDSFNAELHATVSSAGQYQLAGWIKPQAKMPKGIRSILGWIAKGDSQGRYQLALKGQF